MYKISPSNHRNKILGKKSSVRLGPNFKSRVGTIRPASRSCPPRCTSRLRPCQLSNGLHREEAPYPRWWLTTGSPRTFCRFIYACVYTKRFVGAFMWFCVAFSPPFNAERFRGSSFTLAFNAVRFGGAFMLAFIVKHFTNSINRWNIKTDYWDKILLILYRAIAVKSPEETACVNNIFHKII